ncbi:hypothetical protein EDB80DRAFT_731906 [Ilyonectria destructans]|nr:hypothetical protein EDB80DRAFT_731906 [Ilyonectria destructans]
MTGGGAGARRSRSVAKERIVPWRTCVRCQRFFRSRVASGWFEVGRGTHADGGQNGKPREWTK